jgi:hypothetical protein
MSKEENLCLRLILMKRTIPVLLLLILNTPLSVLAQNVELGFKPGHVYGIWEKINQVLLDCGDFSNPDVQFQISPVKGKRPEDVLSQAKLFEHSLIQLMPDVSGHIHLLSDELMFQIKGEAGHIKPTQVYLFSSRLLFQVIRMATKVEKKALLIGPYFKTVVYEDKVPDDVFALVILAQQRLEVLKRQLEHSMDNGSL